MARFISTSTILEAYGLVKISGEVARNPFYTFEERQFEPEFEIHALRVIDADGKVLHSPTCIGQKITHNPEQGFPAAHFVRQLDTLEIEKCEEVLIEKFIDDALDYLIDEAIERGREYARNAYA